MPSSSPSAKQPERRRFGRRATPRARMPPARQPKAIAPVVFEIVRRQPPRRSVGLMPRFEPAVANPRRRSDRTAQRASLLPTNRFRRFGFPRHHRDRQRVRPVVPLEQQIVRFGGQQRRFGRHKVARLESLQMFIALDFHRIIADGPNRNEMPAPVHSAETTSGGKSPIITLSLNGANRIGR